MSYAMEIKSTSTHLSVLLVEGPSEQSRRVREILSDNNMNCILLAVGTPSQALAYLRREPPYSSASTPRLVLLGAGVALNGIFDIAAEIDRSQTLRNLDVLVVANDTPGTGSYINTGVSNIRSVAPSDLAEVIRELQRDDPGSVAESPWSTLHRRRRPLTSD